MGEISVSVAAPQVTVAEGTGAVTVSVTNAGAAPERVVLAVFRPAVVGASPAADPAWASVERPLRDVGPGATVQYVVTFAPPPGTPAATYEAKLVAHPADDAPEEYAERGPVLRLVVPATPPPPPPPPSRWWLWVVAAVVLLAVVGVVVWLLTRGEPTPEPTTARPPVSVETTTIPVGPWPAGVAIEPGTGLVLVTNRDGDSLSVIDPQTRQVTQTLPVPSQPIGVAAEPVGGRIYVANQGAAFVSAVDLASGGAFAGVNTEWPPFGVAVDAERRVWVTVESGRLLLVDPTGGSLLAEVAVGGNPRGVAWNDTDGLLYVANQGSDTVSVVSPDGPAVVATIDVGPNPSGVAVDASDGTVWVTNVLGDSVSVIDPGDLAVVATVPVGINPSAVAVDPEAGVAYVANSDATVSVVDTSSFEVVDTIAVGEVPTALVVDPATGTVYVTDGARGSVSVLEAG